MTLREACIWGQEQLAANGVEDAQLDAWYLLEYVTGVSRASYYADPERKIAEKQEEDYRTLIRKRGEHIPFQHLTGSQEFMGLEFQVNEHVLIPRQDTETLVEHALEYLEEGKVPAPENSLRILDMCTGSGCILLSVLIYAERYIRKNRHCNGKLRIEGTGADVSEEALQVARTNAQKLYPEAGFIQSDLFGNVPGRYSMILSNPPYIRTEEISRLQDEVRFHDPVLALDGREDGLYFYRRIVSEAQPHLEQGGILIFEIGYDQAKDVSELLCKAGYTEITVKKDLAGLDRVVSAVLQ